MAFDAAQYRLSEPQNQAIFKKWIEPRLFADAKAVEKPVAVIFGGQPGSGKSATVDYAMLELQSHGGAVKIDGDALRLYHPRYKELMRLDDKTAATYTGPDSGQWVEKAIAGGKARRVNLVIEGTMRSDSAVAATMESLRAAGYEIDARALAVNFRLSEQGILQRYEGQKADRGIGRMTTPEAHKAAYDGMLVTLERIERDTLADRVTLYRRGGEAIYTNELKNGRWVREPQARAQVEAERARPLTPEQAHQFVQGYATLVQQLDNPQRNATEPEKTAMRARYAQSLEVPIQEEKLQAVVQHLNAKGFLQEQQTIILQRCRANAQWLHEQNPQPGLDAERNRNAPDAHAEPRMGLANLSNQYAYMQALTPSATSQPLHATLPEREAYRQSEPDNGPEP